MIAGKFKLSLPFPYLLPLMHPKPVADSELYTQLEDAAVEYAASKLHQVKKSRGLPTLSATFLRGNIFKEHWCEQLGGPFDCVHVGGSCSKSHIQDLMLLVKQGTLGDPVH